MQQRTRIVLVDDHRLFREGLCSLLAQQPDLEVAGEAGDAQGAYQTVRETSPDVIVLDLVLPGTSGFVIAQELIREDSERRILVLSMLKDEDSVLRALDAGVTGYACKEQSAEEILQAIRAVAQGEQYLPPGMEIRSLEALRRAEGRAGAPGLATLTRREREVFDLTVSGMATAEIARKLMISKRTVETHRARILRKLNAHSATDLVRLAARLGVLTV